MQDLRFAGRWALEFYNKLGMKYAEKDLGNAITNEGLNKILNVMFHGSTAAPQLTTWYIGFIDNASYSALAAADTMASHAGWIECTAYTGNRKEWTEGAASSQAMTNAATVDFAINATKTLKGIFLCSVATGTSGTLWATGAFASTQAVNSGDTVKITYTLTAANG